jgi:hypothetical protein
VRPAEHRRIRDGRVSGQRGGDFGGLDPHSVDLDLIVQTAQH